MPPGVPIETVKTSKLLPQRDVQTILNLSAARAAQDFPRIAALKKEICSSRIQLQLPLLVCAVVRVPYMRGTQKLRVSRVITCMLRKVQCTSWEHQALQGWIRVVRTVPHTVRRWIESQSNQCEKSLDASVCCCTAAYEACWAQGGGITVRDRPYCLLPVTLNFEGATLGSKDPLPSDGASCRADVVTDLEQFARLLNVPVPNLQRLLPHTVFNSSSGMMSHVQSMAQSLSKVAIIRRVDKSLGTMWGFYRAWVREQTQNFLHSERYCVAA